MPRLLFHGEPSCETRLPGTRVGDCVVVYDDGQDSDHGRGARQFLRIDTDMPRKECEALFLAPGVPDEVAQSERDAFAALLVAEEALRKSPPDPKDFLVKSKEQIAVEDARAALETATRATRGWPTRRVHLDLSVLPDGHTTKCADLVAAIEAVKLDADLAEEAMVAASLETIGVSPSAAEKILKPDPTKAVAFEAAPSDHKADEIRDAARVGRALVEDPVLATFEPLAPVFLSADELRKAAVPNG